MMHPKLFQTVANGDTNEASGLACFNYRRRKHQQSKVVLIQSYPVDMLSRQVDVHGCRASAGYTWCQFKGSCIRNFEDDCPTNNPGRQQCGRSCTTTYDCSSNGGIWDTGHAWCGAECNGGRCHPKYQDCKRNSDCDQTKAVCGRQGYCVGK